MEALKCSICLMQHCFIKELLKHFRINHSSMNKYVCNDCKTEYSHIDSFRKHLQKDHLCNNFPIIENESVGVNIQNENTCPILQNQSSDNVENSIEVFNFRKQIFKNILKLICDERIPRSMALNTVNQMISLFKNVIATIKEKAKTCNFGQNDEFQDFFSFLQELDAACGTYTEYHFLKELSKTEYYIQPMYNTIHESREEYVTTDNQLILHNVDFTALYFNFREMFSKLFVQTKFLECVIDFIHDLDKQDVLNYIQSESWKEIVNSINVDNDDSTLFLPLMLYFDDFEPNNVLGSHSGYQKIGAVYIKFPCIPEYMQSKLYSIFLAMLFFSSDRKKFGNSRVFLPLINELNLLSSDGVILDREIRGYRRVIIITVLILGDNLGLNSILGFSEGFNSFFYCRLCKMSKSDCQCNVIEDIDIIRNETNYNIDVIANDLKATGVKENSIFNRLNYYHVTRNYVVDIMHDLLEGVCVYDLSLVIENFIKKYKFFTLELLNYRISTFNYGPTCKNKPPTLNTDVHGKIKIKFSAAEMLNFINVFTIMIGDLVSDCEEWTLILLLKDIIALSYMQFFEKGNDNLLSALVTEHNQIYMQLNQILKPKFHNMIHYARIIRKIGPLPQISSMRFESLHKIFKNTAYSCNSRVNLLKTIFAKYQLRFANFLMNYDEIFSEKIVSGTIQSNKSQFFISKYCLRQCEYTVSFLNYFENVYKKGVVVFVGAEEEMIPGFALIDYIAYDGTSYQLCMRKITNIGLDSHFKAYVIEEEELFFSLPISVVYEKNKSTTYICSANNKKYINWN